MTSDILLNEIITQLREKVKKLKELSSEMRSDIKKRSDDDIQAELNNVLNEMSALHEKANKIIRPVT
jgi:hypothetical protein